MPLETVCPHCGTRYRDVPDRYRDTEVRCQKCGKVYTVKPAPPAEGTMTITCPSCARSQHNAPARLAGRTVKCPDCGHQFVVAAPAAAAPAPEPQAEAVLATPPPAPPEPEPALPEPEAELAAPPIPPAPQGELELDLELEPPAAEPVAEPEEVPAAAAAALEMPADELPDYDLPADELPLETPAPALEQMELEPETPVDEGPVEHELELDLEPLPVEEPAPPSAAVPEDDWEALGAGLPGAGQIAQELSPAPALVSPAEPVTPLPVEPAMPPPPAAPPAAGHDDSLQDLAREWASVAAETEPEPELPVAPPPAELKRAPAAAVEPALEAPAPRRRERPVPEHAAAPPPRPRSRLKPILIGVGLVTVLAIALVVTVMVGRSMPGPTTASPVDTAPRPTAAPRPQPTKPAVSSAATATTAVTDANDPVQLASRARAALDAGNFHEATEILSQPSLVGSRDPSVLDSARRVILALMDQAERAKASGHRDTATERLERARNLALRFSFSTTEIDVKFEELQGRRQALQISPNDSVALGRLRGKDIVVSLKDRTTREGLLRTINPDSITLEARRTVGAGYVTYTTTIPLNTIEVIEPQD